MCTMNNIYAVSAQYAKDLLVQLCVCIRLKVDYENCFHSCDQSKWVGSRWRVCLRQNTFRSIRGLIWLRN